MKIYLAARYSRHPEMQRYAHALQAGGHEVTATWIWGGHDVRAQEMGHSSSNVDALQPVWATEDLRDLWRADTFIAFTEPPGEIAGRGRGGRHVELGVALALHKRVIVVGARENVFCWLPQVEFYPTWAECHAAVLASQEQVA